MASAQSRRSEAAGQLLLRMLRGEAGALFGLDFGVNLALGAVGPQD